MAYPLDYIPPNRPEFAADPFGYGALAWYRWCAVKELHGFTADPVRVPTSAELNDPVLWLSQARALAEAATAVIRVEPMFEQMPDVMKGICDSQYCAAALMLVGYSLEVVLKGMIIVRDGSEQYARTGRVHHHHRLEDLAEFVPGIRDKDRAILRGLSQFVAWAGRYPDPGERRERSFSEIFQQAERHQIRAADVFNLAGRVMAHATTVVDELGR